MRSKHVTIEKAVAAQAKALAATLPRRRRILETRVGRNMDLLDADITAWSDALKAQLPGTPICFHVQEFAVFWKAAYDCLQQQYEHAVGLPGEDLILFEMQVIGTLTAQWSVLRAVAGQRLRDNPYAPQLERLDADMEQLYRRMYRALAEAGVEQVKQWPLPLLYLGRLAEVALPDKQQAPAIISIPFGAAYSAREAQPIAHELGHLPGRRVNGLHDQLIKPATDALAAIDPLHPGLLAELILPWMDEIIADLFGTALAGAPFIVSAVELMTAPEYLVNVADREHPIALIRPYIHLQLLTYLKDEQAKQTVRDELAHYLEPGAAPATAEACLDQLTASLLSRRLELSEKLVPLALKAIKDATIAVVQGILGAAPGVLGGKTFGDVLARCADPSQADGDENKPALLTWGAISDKECETFVLRRPRSTDQEWPGPTLRNVVDDWVQWVQSALGTQPPPPP